MKITRFLNFNHRETIKSIEEICRVILDIDDHIVIESIHGLIENPDTSYRVHSLEDIAFTLKNAMNIHRVYVDVTFRFTDESRKYTHASLGLDIGKETALSITVGLPDTTKILEVFDRLSKDVFKKTYYKHNEKSENSRLVSKTKDKVVEIFENLSELQVRSLREIKNEKDFQDFSYSILRSHFNDLEDEHYLPKYGTKTYKPDFGIPSGKLLIELKHIKNMTDLKKRQSEIHDDVIGYLSSSERYKSMIVAIYNQNNIAINRNELKKLENHGIYKIVICNHVMPNGSLASR